MPDGVNGECAAATTDSGIALTASSGRGMLNSDREDDPVTEPKSCDTGESRCPSCGTTFECGYAAGQSRCWCFELPTVPVNDQCQGCLCPRCLAQRLEDGKENRETANVR
jgi:hypothetical protein